MVDDQGQRLHRGDHLRICGECGVDVSVDAGVVISGIGRIPRISENNGGG